ncbi:glycosyl hydrolases family 35-domain-containing protein [Mycena galericulata]|nr:glycosyl hydrolases family 35-domain-containing protein [Mycena galericulata]
MFRLTLRGSWLLHWTLEYIRYLRPTFHSPGRKAHPGEFHPFRLPSPELWYDILQKFKAAGFNALFAYWHWGLSAPNPSEIRFTQHNDLAKFFTVAKEVGILVVVRPGPYINAETAAGGIPGWATNVPGLARTNASTYREAWFPYLGGAFSYWSGPGYEQCYKLINEQFANVYYKNNYASGAAIQNLYMTYGGTNWGGFALHEFVCLPSLFARVEENPLNSDLFKLRAYFLHASPDYLLVGRVGNGTVGLGTAFSNSTDIYTTNLESAASKANFYIVRQLTNTKITDTDFTLRVNTTLEGEISIPKAWNLTLAGRESKIIVTNYPFGSSKLEYSTAEVLTWSTFEKNKSKHKTIVLYALEGQYVEIVVELAKTEHITHAGSSTISAKATGKVCFLSSALSAIDTHSVDYYRGGFTIRPDSYVLRKHPSHRWRQEDRIWILGPQAFHHGSYQAHSL